MAGNNRLPKESNRIYGPKNRRKRRKATQNLRGGANERLDLFASPGKLVRHILNAGNLRCVGGDPW